MTDTPPVDVAPVANPQPVNAIDPIDREQQDLKRRLTRGIVLGLPLFALAVTDLIFDGRPLTTTLGKMYFGLTWNSATLETDVIQKQGVIVQVVLEAILATAIVFWCGAPLLAKFWRSIRLRQLDMFTLIGLGIGASYFYSAASLAYLLTEVKPLANRQDATTSELVPGGKVVQGVVEGTSTSEKKGMIDPFFESAAGIVIFVLIGQILELRARQRSGDAVRKLISFVPIQACRIRQDGSEVMVSLDFIRSGDLISVKPGQRFPVDGILKEGVTTVDESMLTGEPLSVEKGPGMRVLAGTQNGLRPVIVVTEKVKDETMLSQVIHLVDQAQKIHIPLERTVDEIAKWFVPAVIIIAFATFIGWSTAGLISTNGDFSLLVQNGWITYAVICAVGVLVIACPCALGLATPLAVSIGMTRAANNGVLFRDGTALEKLSDIDTIVFDKTGTLTEGKPWLVAVEGGVGDEPNAVLALAAAVERGSEHPVGSAIVWEAVKRNLTIDIATDVEAIPGKGVRGKVNGERVVVGSFTFLKESGMHLEMLFSQAHSHRINGHSVIAIGVRDRCAGLVAISDPLRTSSKKSIAQLLSIGIRPMILTGDNADTAKSVARRLGIEDVTAETLPIEKFAVIERLKKEGSMVAMVGDGINDAPALAAANVGIAMGTGNKIAISSADITLVRPDLENVIAARTLSIATVRTIHQNLWLALVYNALAIPVAAGLLVPFGGGLISPIWAAAAMSLSTVSVVLNSMRLARKGVAKV